MIYIDRTGHRPDPIWLSTANELTQQLLNATTTQEIHTIIDANEDIWGEVKDFLLDISHQKCWYSESKDKYSYLHVDHFRPKKAAIGLDKKDYGGYWWLAFEWQNYRVCGGVGNVIKRDKFAIVSNKANNHSDNLEDEIPYFLDPTQEEDTLKLTFTNNGEIAPIENSGWDHERAKYTITHLKLNHKKLKEARQTLWLKCATLVEETQVLMQLNNNSPSTYRRGQINEKLKQLKELVRQSDEFSATARTCLRSTGFEWAMKIAS